MATSITKLAAVLSADAAAFDAGMSRAGQRIQQLERQQAASNAKMLASTRQIATATGAFGRFGGLAAPLTGALGPIGLLATALTAAGAAAYNAFQNMKKLNEAFDARMTLAIRERAEAFKALHGSLPEGYTPTLTAEERKALEEQGKAFARQQVADVVTGRQSGMMGIMHAKAALAATNDQLVEAQQRREEQVKKVAEETKSLVEDLKAQEAAEKRLADAVQKHREALEQLNLENQKRADSIRDSLLTPTEKMQRSFAELNALFEGGFLSRDTFGRGISKAAEDFRETMNRAMRERISLTEAPAALERGSVAEFSARVQSALQSKRLESLAAESVKIEKRIEEHARATAAGISELAKKKPFGVTDL